MAHFGSINEFRAALNSLVGSTARPNLGSPGPKAKARKAKKAAKAAKAADLRRSKRPKAKRAGRGAKLFSRARKNGPLGGHEGSAFASTEAYVKALHQASDKELLEEAKEGWGLRGREMTSFKRANRYGKINKLAAVHQGLDPWADEDEMFFGTEWEGSEHEWAGAAREGDALLLARGIEDVDSPDPWGRTRRRGRRARRNMAWPKYVVTHEGAAIPADDPAELRDLLKTFPGSRVTAREGDAPFPPPVAPPAVFDDDPLGAGFPSPPFMPSYTAPKKEKRGRPLARNNFLRIGKSVGGWGTLCPGLSPDPFRSEGVTATEGALRAAGVTDQMAAAVAHTMDQAGVLQKTTKSLGKEKRAIAQQIFAQMTGFTCPLAVSNRSRRNPVSWTRAY